MHATRRRTAGLLLTALLLALATPAWLALTRPGLRTYLLHPVIFAVQAGPYVLAAALWLPPRNRTGIAIGQWLAALLLLAAGLLYIPMLTGAWATGGDMVGLAFIAIATVTAAAILGATAIAWTAVLVRHRARHRAPGHRNGDTSSGR